MAKGKKGFAKGDPNINRGGRPPKGKTFVDKFYQYTDDDEFIQIGLKLVRDGDRDLWKYFADRIYGKIKDELAIDGIEIIFTNKTDEG